MGGRKPSQTTALDAILEITQKYKKEVLAAAEKVGRLTKLCTGFIIITHRQQREIRYVRNSTL